MIIPFNHKNISIIGYFLGIFYSVIFNASKNNYDYVISFAYSIPFILLSVLIGVAISKIRKNKLSGVYFLIACLLLVSFAP